MTANPYLIIALIVLVILIISGALIMIRINKRPASNTVAKLPFDINVLVAALGKINNIEAVDAKLSKLNVKLKDTALVDVEAIKKLGASGIIKKSAGFTFIFGSLSEKISAELNKLLP